mgnify:CR=1 FL=1
MGSVQQIEEGKKNSDDDGTSFFRSMIEKIERDEFAKPSLPINNYFPTETKATAEAS